VDVVAARHVTSRLEMHHRYVHKSGKVPADGTDTTRDIAHGVYLENSTTAVIGHSALQTSATDCYRRAEGRRLFVERIWPMVVLFMQNQDDGRYLTVVYLSSLNHLAPELFF